MSDSISHGQYPLKIIHAGFHRAGTTSLSKTLDKLGYGPTWHLALNSAQQNQIGVEWWTDHEMDKHIENNTVNAKLLDDWLNTIQCFTIMDAPSVLYWETFHRFYPNAKVILSVRDPNELYESGVAVWNSAVNRWWFGILLWMMPWLRWKVEVYETKVMEKKGQKSIHDKEACLQYYTRHLQYVKSKFAKQKDQLLIFDACDGWDPLCQFLNVPIPHDTPFPRKHKRGDKKGKKPFESGISARKIMTMIAVPVTLVCVGLCVKYYFKKSKKV